MTSRTERRLPEIVYALLTVVVLAAIIAASWGVLTLSVNVITSALRPKEVALYQQRIDEITKRLTAETDTPNSLWWDHLRRGNAYLEIKRYDDAARDFTEANKYAQRQHQFETALMRLAAVSDIQGKPQEALAYLDQAIAKAASSDTQGYVVRAELRNKLGQTDAALADLDIAASLDPSNSPGFAALRVMLAFRVGHLADAASASAKFLHEIIIENTCAKLQEDFNKASLAGRFDDAIKFKTKLIALRPKNFRDRLDRSDMYLWSKRTDRALEDINAAIALNPISTEPRKYLADAYYYMQRGEEALPLLNAVIARDPEYGQAYLSRGLLNFQLHRFAQTADDFKAAIFADREYAVLWLHLTQLAAKQSDTKELTANVAEFYNPEDGEPAWPYPVTQYFLGKLSERALIDKASQEKDPQTKRDQRCEAQFYAGMDAKLHGRTAHGLELIEAAHRECHPGFIEYAGAEWELQRAAKAAPQKH